MDEFALFKFSNFYYFQDQLYDVERLRNPCYFAQFGFNVVQNMNNYYKPYLMSGVKKNICEENDSPKTYAKQESCEFE